MSCSMPNDHAVAQSEIVRALPPAWAAEIECLLAESRTPGAAIALITPDSHHMHCFGRMKASEDRPVEPDTLFGIASLSKAFVATLALVLAEQGRLDLDDPVHPLLPELCFTPDWINDEISLRDLLSNRLGLQRGGVADYGLPVTADHSELIRRFSAMRRCGPFRGRYSYCNPAFDAAVLVMERLTGASYDKLLDEYLLGPAGMAPALICEAARLAPRRATAHVFDRQNRLSEVDLADEWARPGAGGLLSSAQDQLRWIALNLGEGRIDGRRVLPRSIWQQMWAPHIHIPASERELWLGTCESSFAAYALGWFVTDFYGRPMAVHSGGGVGWRARIALLPDQGIGLSVLLNAYGTVGTTIQHRLLELCLDLPPRPWNGLIAAKACRQRATGRAQLDASWPRSAAPQTAAADIVGEYVNAESGIATIAETAGRASISFKDGPIWNGPLVSLGGDVFEHDIASPIATFDGPDALCPRLCFVREDDRVVALDHSTMGRFERC